MTLVPLSGKVDDNNNFYILLYIHICLPFLSLSFALLRSVQFCQYFHSYLSIMYLLFSLSCYANIIMSARIE